MKNASPLRTALLLAAVFCLGRTTLAQDLEERESRLEIGLDFAQTLGTSTFSSTQTIRDYAEDGTLTSSYAVKKAPGGGLHLQYNFTNKLGVRIGGQTFSRKSDGTFTGRIPHPFFFNRPRAISGTQSGLNFTESAFSLTAVLRGGSGKWNFALEGGPAIFSVNADLAERARYTEVYPYDTITFGGASTVKEQISPIGFAVGAEVGRQVGRSVAVVAQARYTKASGSVDVNSQSVDVKAGGVQARIGIRFILARKQ